MPMRFREPNRARWVGARPAHDGTQVAASGSHGVGSIVLHTVGDGKVFYLCVASVTYRALALNDEIMLSVRNAADVRQYDIVDFYCHAVDYGGLTVPFWPPLEIPEKYDVAILITGATAYGLGFIHGWEENV